MNSRPQSTKSLNIPGPGTYQIPGT